jgi:dTDP-4-amino-4,6-dideoxygalactose transaminase
VRYRIYGGPANYLRFARDLCLGRHRTHRDVAPFEAELAGWFGARHAVLTSLARVAIHDVVRAWVPAGHGVVLSPYTIVDVVNMVVAAGAVPVFADVDARTGNLDPDAAARAFDTATVPIAMILVTHLHGVTANLAALRALADARGVRLVEDAAQALGAVLDGRRAGAAADAGIVSLGSYKNVNAHFGGVVLTDDDDLATAVRAARDARPTFPLRHLLRKARESLVTDLLGAHPFFGAVLFPLFRTALLRGWERINRLLRIELDTALRPTVPAYMLGRPTDLQVRSARAQWPHIDRDAAHRIACTRRTLDGLAGHPDLRLPPPPDGLRHVYTYVAVQVVAPDDATPDEARATRTSLVHHLAACGRDLAPQHLHDVSGLPDFRRYGGHCPIAARVAASVVLLPTYPGYDDAQVEANVGAVRSWRVTRRDTETACCSPSCSPATTRSSKTPARSSFRAVD